MSNFLMFAIAFVVDCFMRGFLAIATLPDGTEPFFYLGRLLSFSLIVVAIIDKNLGDTHEVARPQTETEKTLKICA